MKPLTLCYYSATAMEISSLSQGIRNLKDSGDKITVYARTQTQLFDKRRIEKFVQAALSSDMIILNLHGGQNSCPAFERLIEERQRLKNSDSCKPSPFIPRLHIQSSSGDEDGLLLSQKYSDDFGTPIWDRVSQYLSFGGHINFTNLLRFLKGHLLGEEDLSSAPQKLPNEGIYRREFSHIPTLGAYIKTHVHPQKITVGLWFNQSYWLNNNTAFIDAMIDGIEKAGANVIPVFHLRFKDTLRKNKGADDIIDLFFMKNGKPIIDVLINPMMFSLTLAHPSYQNILAKLSVPVIQAMMTLNPVAHWEESTMGMSVSEVSYCAAQPEFDGALITVPVASREQKETDAFTGALIAKYCPIEDRIEKMVHLSLNWAKLRRKKNQEKKVAIIFHHYPPRNDRIGCAAGLDSFESVVHLLNQMKQTGYHIEKSFENGDALSKMLLNTMTCDQRWLLPEQMSERCHVRADKNKYIPWHNMLKREIREKMVKDWGDIPGELFVHNGEMLFPGFINGNILITIQPPRGYLESIDKIYHDLYLSPPHHYLSHYRYIKEVFKADAVIHVGKHGSLEWLPGKALGLSNRCYPDLAIMDLPNIYPYIINDPGEGTQAKRRSYSCIIDHLTPCFTSADLYESLAKIDQLIKAYREAKSEDPAKLAILKPMIWEAFTEANLDKDLSITMKHAFENFDRFLLLTHEYLTEIEDTMINDGLHVLGKAPEKNRLNEFIVQLTRISNGEIPSLRESVIKAMGYDPEYLFENKGMVILNSEQKTGGELIIKAHEIALDMITSLSEKHFQKVAIRPIVKALLNYLPFDVILVLEYICDTLIPNIQNVSDEMASTFKALDGKFVSPGPSGAPTRGEADILPTGRNFYSVDPNKIPSPAAWEVGKKLGDALIQRYLKETGNYPESVGIIVYGTVTMRTKGDDIAEIFYLLGVKPEWHPSNGRMIGLSVIPQSELKRPRIDVVPRISGFFRDSFPLLVECMDEAIQMVALLDESIESNLIRKHVLKDLKSYQREGMDEKAALREATFRIFGCPPGSYGAGVSKLVESKNWKTREDLGNNYIRYSSHAYGNQSYGMQKPQTFRTLLKRMNVTVKNEDSREYDMMSCTDYYNYYGGLIAAVETVKGDLPVALFGDSADPERVKMRTTFEEAKHVLRARLVNPKWLKGMMRHGYKGAGDISHMMDVVLGWDATSDVIEDWMYESIAQKYALDETMKEWMSEVNPYARQNIIDKLLEAISRSMWNADSEMEARLKEEYLEMEGQIEEITE